MARTTRCPGGRRPQEALIDLRQGHHFSNSLKYFSIQWWSFEVEDSQKPVDEYQAYIESILEELPDALKQLAREVSLHDAHLRTFHFDSTANILRLEFDCLGFDPSTKEYYRRKTLLSYQDVSSIVSTSDPKAGLCGPHGYGDLGYDEIEIIAPGHYEHRMLFSTGIEIQVQFSTFFVSFQEELEQASPLPA